MRARARHAPLQEWVGLDACIAAVVRIYVSLKTVTQNAAAAHRLLRVRRAHAPRHRSRPHHKRRGGQRRMGTPVLQSPAAVPRKLRGCHLTCSFRPTVPASFVQSRRSGNGLFLLSNDSLKAASVPSHVSEEARCRSPCSTQSENTAARLTVVVPYVCMKIRGRMGWARGSSS